MEAKQSVVENMAPVLTRLFTPLFAAVLVAFLVTMLWTGSGIGVGREVLIGFDLLLVLVLGLLFVESARRFHASLLDSTRNRQRTVPSQDLSDHIRHLEERLLDPDIRRSPDVAARLLADEFFEF